jgi:hypothetical protein
VRNTSTPLPYERTNTPTQPRARNQRFPFRTPDFSNMNLAPRNLIQRLDRVRNRPVRAERPQMPRRPFPGLNFMNRGKR